MKQLLIFLLALMCAWPAHSQKFLQLEKSGSLKSTRFYPGDELTFRLKNDDTGWYTRLIYDFDLENNLILVQGHELPLDSISMIRLPRTKAMQIVGGALQVGGINMILFSAYYSIFRDYDADWSTILSGVANIAVGTALRSLFASKRFKPGKRKRLRLLDLNFSAPIPNKS